MPPLGWVYTTNYINTKSTTVYVPRRNWDYPNPSIASECAPPPQPGGGGHIRLRMRGWGSPNPDDWRKSLTLCLLCGTYCTVNVAKKSYQKRLPKDAAQKISSNFVGVSSILRFMALQYKYTSIQSHYFIPTIVRNSDNELTNCWQSLSNWGESFRT